MQKGIFGSNAFINNEDIYENYLYFPNRFRRVKYNYEILTDFTYRNVKDKIVPLLQELYIKANYNKDTKKMFNILKPMLIDLYQLMNQYFEAVKQFNTKYNTLLSPSEEKYKRNLMNDLNDNVGSISDYITDMINKINLIINHNTADKKEDIDETYFVQNVNTFNRIRIINDLNHSKLK